MQARHHGVLPTASEYSLKLRYRTAKPWKAAAKAPTRKHERSHNLQAIYCGPFAVNAADVTMVGDYTLLMSGAHL